MATKKRKPVKSRAAATKKTVSTKMVPAVPASSARAPALAKPTPPTTLDELTDLMNHASELLRKGTLADIDESLRLTAMGLVAFPKNYDGLAFRAAALREREAFEPGSAEVASIEVFEHQLKLVRDGKARGVTLMDPARGLVWLLKSKGQRERALGVLEQVRDHVQYDDGDDDKLSHSFERLWHEIAAPGVSASPSNAIRGAIDAEDPDAAIAALLALARLNDEHLGWTGDTPPEQIVFPGPVYNAMRIALGGKAVEPLRPLWVALQRDRFPRVSGPDAYNVARLAARLQDKPAMLDWLRVANALGENTRKALKDRDFAAYHKDRDFTTLAREKRARVERTQGFTAGHSINFWLRPGKKRDGEWMCSAKRDNDGLRVAKLYGIGNPNAFPIRLVNGKNKVQLEPHAATFQPERLYTELTFPIEFAAMVSVDDTVFLDAYFVFTPEKTY